MKNNYIKYIIHGVIILLFFSSCESEQEVFSGRLPAVNIGNSEMEIAEDVNTPTQIDIELYQEDDIPSSKEGTVTVNIQTEDGISYGSDFTTSPDGSSGSFTLTIPAGERTASFDITPVNENNSIEDKDVVFELSDATGGIRMGGKTKVKVTIKNDDESIAGYELNTSVDTIPDFGSVISGNSSEPKSIILTGNSLTQDVVISSPSSFPISLDSLGTYKNSLEIKPDEINGKQIKIFVKYLPSNGVEGEIKTEISVASYGIKPFSVAVSGIEMMASGDVETLVVNGDFKDWIEGDPTDSNYKVWANGLRLEGWRPTAYGDNGLSVLYSSTTDAISENKAMKITVAEGRAGSSKLGKIYAGSEDDFVYEVEGGATYKISMYLKSNRNDGALFLYLDDTFNWYDANGDYLDKFKPGENFVPETNWKKFEYEFEVPVSVASVQLRFRVNQIDGLPVAGDWIIMDNLALTKTGQGSPDYVSNGDISSWVNGDAIDSHYKVWKDGIRPEGWRPTAYGDNDLAVEYSKTSDAQIGDFALKVTVNEGRAGSSKLGKIYAGSEDDVVYAVEGGSIYELSLFVKGSRNDGALFLYLDDCLNWYDANGASLGSLKPGENFVPETNWKKFTYEFEVPATAASVKIRFRMNQIDGQPVAGDYIIMDGLALTKK
jgi:hypothetical protein